MYEKKSLEKFERTNLEEMKLMHYNYQHLDDEFRNIEDETPRNDLDTEDLKDSVDQPNEKDFEQFTHLDEIFQNITEHSPKHPIKHKDITEHPPKHLVKHRDDFRYNQLRGMFMD